MAVNHVNRVKKGNKRDKILKCDVTGIDTLQKLLTALSNGLYADIDPNNVVGDGTNVIGSPINKIELDKMLAAEGITTGTSSAFILDNPSFSLIDGAPIRIKFHIIPVDGATLNIGGTGAKIIKQAYSFSSEWTSIVYEQSSDTYKPQSIDTQYVNRYIVTESVSTHAVKTPFSIGRSALGGSAYGDGTNAGSVIFIGGNIASQTTTNTTEGYNISGTKFTGTSLMQARSGFACCENGSGNVIVAGGDIGGANTNIVERINGSGVRTTLTSLPNATAINSGGTDGNANSIIAGGSGGITDVVKYDTSGTRTILTSLSAPRFYMASATDGNGRVYFAGGYTTGASNVVEAFDTSGTKFTMTPLSVARMAPAGSKYDVGKVMFAGGSVSGNSNVVDVYDTSGTRTTITPLSVARDSLAANKDGANRTIIAGGMVGTGYSNVVESYDSSGTRSILESLSVARVPASAVDGNGTVYFAGGMAAGSVYSPVVETYTKGGQKTITVMPGSKYKFADMATEDTATGTTISVKAPNTGYVRYGGDIITI